MPKTKESSASGRNEGSDCLSSYIQMKSPFLGSLEFEVSVPEIPVDPCLLSYEPNMAAIAYEPSVLELSERLTAFHEFERGLECKALDGMCYSGLGIEDESLILRLNEDFEKLKTPGVAARLTELRREMMQSPAMQVLQPLIGNACEEMPANVQRILFASDDSKLNVHEDGRTPMHQKGSGLGDHDETMLEKWNRMNLNDRVEHYISHINDTFVPVESLQHPTNPNAKIAKHYKVMPNVGLWKNRYIQAGIEGISSVSSSNSVVDLEVGSILNVAKEGATQRIFEYYKRAESIHESDVKSESKDQEMFTFVRMYSCQQSAKTAGNDNYYLLSLPPRLHNKVKSRIYGGTDLVQALESIDTEESLEEDVADSVVHILSVKGQKLVLTKAGKAKRPDIMLTYTEDFSPT